VLGHKIARNMGGGGRFVSCLQDEDLIGSEQPAVTHAVLRDLCQKESSSCGVFAPVSCFPLRTNTNVLPRPVCSGSALQMSTNTNVLPRPVCSGSALQMSTDTNVLPRPVCSGSALQMSTDAPTRFTSGVICCPNLTKIGTA
jgi:hypothetical protein